MFNGTFSNNPTGSTLIISDKFVYGATESTEGSTRFTKTTLNEKAMFNTSAKLIRNGVEITA